MRLTSASDGIIRVAARSALFNLSDPGNASLGHNFDGTGPAVFEPPFNVRVDVGRDGGNAVPNCTTKPRRFRCGH